MSKFLTALNEKSILIADGATGTMLQKAGLAPGAAPERWNLENPAAICALYRAYIDAGADMILTNTFGGTPARLERDGLRAQVHAVNLAAAQLAREVAGDQTLVIGDIGPTGQMLEPLGSLTYTGAVAGFAAQAAALAEGGADAILIETMSDLNEATAAIEGARQVTALPILATMSFDTKGRTMMGVKPEQAAQTLWGMGVAVVGANCGRTLSETLDAVLKMRAAVPEAVLMAKPNAGLPHAAGGELVYDVTPAIMAEYAQRFVAEAGVKIFGGCCGSTPDHIRAVAAVLKR
ncbi:MAG TPA: homocysteine S-methyltransferase family protein [Anaerolineae bacterium]|nr:homocysteine S-methyltransferase family protein [Anaerolineae bacterium]HQH38383.1 homocysteine S-methyltransferase family protein [Anaerolineae bacterium]